jgi:D-glycero-D-manno-heptose 1,7-bisphosphate phosphatase
MSLKPAVFLDRDGVLNVYLPGDYVKTPEELLLVPGAAQAVRKLNDAGLPLFLISNQQGVAKGIMTQAGLDAVDASLREKLASEGDAQIGTSYYCPHASSASCECRKPRAGMLLQAAREHSIDLAASAFIGDTETDSQAARAAGVGRFILVLSGKFAGRPEVADDTARFPIPPDYVAPDLAAAVDWLLAQ